MSPNPSPSPAEGRVASLHLHPAEAGHPMQAVKAMELVADTGIAGEPRYYGRVSSVTHRPSDRQVSLIAREQIAEHAAALGLDAISPGVVRSNIETMGIDLLALLGREVRVGEAIVRFHSPRTPCHKMDAIAPGLRALMENDRQGVIARIVKSGTIRMNDPIRPLPSTGAVG